MSYILDALKKADAERNAGTLPNIHSQPALPPSGPGERSWRRALLLLAGLILLATFALLYLMRPADRPAPPATERPAAAPDPVLAGKATPPEADTPAAPEPRPVRRDAATPKRAGVAEKKEVRQAEKPKTAQQEAEPRPQAEPKPPAKSTPSAKPKPAAEPKLASLQDLPAALRNEIPALTVNGYIYSPNPADRTVLINGKLLREGDQIAPGLTLETLKAGGMVLNYRGHRYQRSY